VVVQTAPAVRVGLGEELGMKPGERVTGKMVAALKRLGFNSVLDTDFSADLTIVEEGNELLSRLKKAPLRLSSALATKTIPSPARKLTCMPLAKCQLLIQTNTLIIPTSKCGRQLPTMLAEPPSFSTTTTYSMATHSM